MGDFTGSITVDQSRDTVFSYLGDVHNLPQYFARLTAAEPTNGDEVQTTAKLPDGRQVSGTAWFKIDHEKRRVEWGSEGSSGYCGHLDVSGSDTTSQVDVALHTERVDNGNPDVQQGINETLSNIKRLVEQRRA